MKKIGGGLVVAVVLLATLSGCAMTSVRQHPDFASGQRKIKVVAILPSEVEYRHLVFTGENERDSAREQSIATDIESGMSSVLESHGYAAKSDILDKARSGDKDFNFQLEQLKDAYVQVAKEMYAQPMVPVEKADKFKVGVGPLANPFATLAGADALMLARYQGFDKSKGLVAKEIVASALLAALTGSYYVPANNGGTIELSLIDGVSGEILWSNVSGGPVGAYASLTSAMTKLPSAPVSEDVKAAANDAPNAPVVTAAAPAEAPKAAAAQPDASAAKTERAPQAAAAAKAP